MINRNEQLELAKLAEQAKRYPDMIVAMRKIIEMDGELTDEERNLFSISYKQVVIAYRLAWRTLSEVVQDVENSEFQREIAKKYQKTIKIELMESCNEVLTLLNRYLNPKARTSESKMFYLKMKGDYNRYLTEVANSDDRQRFAEESERAYSDGFEIAKTHTRVTNPMRLSLALSLSVFYFEILNKKHIACCLAKEAFDDGFRGLAELDGEAYRGNYLNSY
uniref:Tyrosine 3/tryptophan 5-monooxygenase activation protein zeta polypeptide-like protein n=1 Tax=Adineta vaga TaxID=104782 RepID=B3G4K3_ADIVA|nr:tyrosine 3/tryptophan 5-monooxygenase activation protein zeta polypeptide-like protein [Adineta vaga]